MVFRFSFKLSLQGTRKKLYTVVLSCTYRERLMKQRLLQPQAHYTFPVDQVFDDHTHPLPPPLITFLLPLWSAAQA